jgi:hypothetical protein
VIAAVVVVFGLTKNHLNDTVRAFFGMGIVFAFLLLVIGPPFQTVSRRSVDFAGIVLDIEDVKPCNRKKACNRTLRDDPRHATKAIHRTRSGAPVRSNRWLPGSRV